MRKNSIVQFLCATALVAGASNAFAADVTFSDSTFDLSQYSESAQFTSNSAPAFDQCANCGNPGTALQIFTTVPAATTGSYAQGFVNNTFSYDPPTQGTISTISAMVDKNFSNNVAITGATNTFRPLIEQDGNYYLAAIPGALIITGSGGGTTGYQTLSASGLTAANFQEYDFTTGGFVAGTPNFAGDTMLFGLGQITHSPAGGSSEVDYDNLSIVVSTVPLPAAMWLFGSGLLGLAGMTRRKKT